MHARTLELRDRESIVHRSISATDRCPRCCVCSIDMGDRQFQNLMKKLGGDSVSGVNWRRFLDFFKQDLTR